MRKLYLLVLMVGLFLVACNPNKSIYEDLDALATPYTESISYTLTAADYSTISANALKLDAKNKVDSAYAREIKTFLSFGTNRPVGLFPEGIKAFMKSKFPAFANGSVIQLKYDFSHFTKSFSVGTTIPLAAGKDAYVFSAQDYINIGGTVATNGFIRSGDMSALGFYIKTFIFPNAPKDQTLLLTYKYSATGTGDNLFVYDGSVWSSDVNIGYVFTNGDYAALGGTGSGQPGQYNNFSSSLLPSVYLPFWLKTYKPYNAVLTSGESRYVVYAYYTGSTTEKRISKYAYNSSVWSDKAQISAQYSNNAQFGWVFDPTIRFTLTKADYQLVVDYAKSIKPAYMRAGYTNEEYWFGANAYYVEFSVRKSTRVANDPGNELGLTGKTDAEIKRILNDKVKEALMYLLETKFPNAQPKVNGIDVIYYVTYAMYRGQNPPPPFTAKYQCTGTGKFTLLEYIDSEI